MPSVTRFSARALQRAKRIPNRVRRELHQARDRVDRRGPTLSVVIPVYNVREWIEPALESVVSQSLRDLEIIVVNDGSTDGSMDIVERFAADDPRIRIITQANAGLGAARNTGADHATGRFICFFDSDDLLMPGAYEAMVDQLRTTGSEFVTAAFARGDESEARRPNWVMRTMGQDRACLTVRAAPWMLLDITAWNKVFRRSFWVRHRFRFVEGVRYEDQVPITRAYLTARSFDVLRMQVYVWRTRFDGTSITQQKSSLVDLTDRLRSQQECAQLINQAPDEIRETWYLKLLDYDLPNYLVAALNADEDYTRLLRARLESLRGEVPESVWHRVPFRNRSISWVLSHGRLDRGADLRAWFERERFGLAVELRGDHLEFVPPFELESTDLPPWLCRVHDADVNPVVRLVETFWDDDTLVLRGSAYLGPIPRDYAPHELELRLIAPDETRIPVELSHYSDPALDDLARLTYLDMTDTGFEARIDGAWLAATAPAGQPFFGLEFRQRQGEFERLSDITHVFNVGSGGFRQPHECGGRMVRLAGVVDTGHRILVHDTFAWATGFEDADGSALDVTLRTPSADPVVAAFVKDDASKKAPDAASLPLHVDGSGATVVRLEPGAGRPLVVRHRSGERSPVLWGARPNVVGHDGGGFVHRGLSQRVVVDEPRPAVTISAVQVTDTALVVRGSSLGAAGQRLQLHSNRSRALPSPVLPSGDFEVSVPVQLDPWGMGPTALAAGIYELGFADHDDKTGDWVAEQDYVFADTALRRDFPLHVDAPGQLLTVGVTHTSRLTVESRPVPSKEAAPRQQGRLRHEVYAAARDAEPLPAVLFETFSGQSTGDSPAAIAKELVERGSELDLVWSLADGSVPTPPGTRGVPRFSEEWYELLGRAQYLVNNNNFPHFFRKSPQQVYVQTWHGTPLKKIANDIGDKRYFSMTYQRTMDYETQAWDFLVSPSPYCTEILPRAFGYEGTVLESGYPRNDALVGAGAESTRRAVRERLGITEGDRVLLYAPTWRESAKLATGGHSKVMYLDPTRVVDAVPGSVLLARGHANTAMARSVAADSSRRVIDVTLYPEISDLFLAADVLITDYSSVMFDFAVLDRPMAFLVPDLDSYRDRDRGFYFDFAAEAPGPLLDDEEALIEHLRGGSEVDIAYKEARESFRTRFAPLDDGHAAARVVDRVFGERRG